MTAPIIIRNPKLFLQPLTAVGADDGAAVDVTCDMASVELAPDTPTNEVETFCGVFSIPDAVRTTITFEVTVNQDTYTRWAALVGKTVRAEIFDRGDTDTTFRQVDTQIVLNPALYGPTTPGDPRTVSFTPPTLSDVTQGTVES